MATDATGTPTTNFSIPKFDTTNDSPSGLGFNAAMDAIDTTLAGFPQSPAGIVSGEAMVYNGTTWARSSVTNLGLSSIAQGGATSGQVLTWNGSAWAPSTISSGATVATSTAGLPGSPSNGEQAILRINTTPYTYLTLTYDSTYAKWVSPIIQRAVGGGRAVGHGSITNSYAAYSQMGFDHIASGPYTSAGLTLQVSVIIGDMYGNSGTTYAMLYEAGANSGSAFGAGTAVTGTELSTTATSSITLSQLTTTGSTWSNLSKTTDLTSLVWYIKNSASTGVTVAHCKAYVRAVV